MVHQDLTPGLGLCLGSVLGVRKVEVEVEMEEIWDGRESSTMVQLGKGVVVEINTVQKLVEEKGEK